MDKKKSYVIDLSIEVVTEDDEAVKAISLLSMKNELIPIRLWCDFLGRLSWMTPGENVMLAPGGKRKPLVEKDKGYVITENYGEFTTGDIFWGVDDYELQHCRSGEVIRVNRELMESLFRCVGDFDVRWAAPISPENMEMIERIKKEMKL